MFKVSMFVFLISLSAFATDRVPANGTSMAIETDDAKLYVQIEGASAEKLFKGLKVVPTPGMGHETLRSISKNGANISCHEATHYDASNWDKVVSVNYSCTMTMDSAGKLTRYN